jgi:CubicO group peptidase (beta-lactamase class C family)
MTKLSCLIAVVILLSCKSENPDQRIEAIDTYLRGQAQHFKFNGNVLVAEKGKISYQKSFGVSDYQTKAPLNDSSVFELASVSKQFTAAGILLLERQGKLALNDSLRKFFPELPYSVSLHQMLTHTSGLPDYEYAMGAKWDRTKIAFNRDLIRFLAAEKLPVNFKAGKKWEYSNTGYALLASVIEKVSGMSYKEFLATNIFRPLDMKHTRVYNTRRSGERLENYAYGFVWSDSLERFVMPDSLPSHRFVYYLDGIVGDGTVNSTANDLLKWDRALAGGTLLEGASVAKMTSPHALSDTLSSVSYGYGLFVGKDEFGNYVSHSGSWPGYATGVVRHTDADKTIIILSNNESPAIFIQKGIANILFGQAVTLPYQHTATQLDSASLDLFTGSFAFNGWSFDIIRERDTLFQVFGPGYRRTYLPESPSKIFPIDGQDIQFEVERNDKGELKHYVIAYGVKEEMIN